MSFVLRSCDNGKLPRHVHALHSSYSALSREVLALDVSAGSADVISIFSRAEKKMGMVLSQNVVYEQFLHHYVPLLAQGHVLKEPAHFSCEVEKATVRSSIIGKSHGIAIRALFKIDEFSIKDRTFILLKQQGIEDQQLLQYTLGNVDLFLMGQRGLNGEDINVGAEGDVTLISEATWIEVARFLDRGQRLNIAELQRKKPWHFSQILPKDPYSQHYSQIGRYIKHGPSGMLILKNMKERFYVAHQSPFKKEILSSDQLCISRGGCIGNLVYTTELMGQEGTLLGGHALGLLERKFVRQDQCKDHLLLMEVKKTGNVFTNWIDKLGRGPLVLSARDELMRWDRCKNHLKVDAQNARLCLSQYEMLFPLFQITLSFSYSQNSGPIPDHLIERFFEAVITWKEGPYTLGRGSIFHGILFETIKDYILLFQDDEVSKEFRRATSFNMGLQYHIFFSLCPEMKQHWDTSNFNPFMAEILAKLKEVGMLKKQEDIHAFKRFFLERLSYYIHVGVLEGITSLPDPEGLIHFEQLKNYLPNLAGLLFHYCLKKVHKKEPFYQNLATWMRKEYHKFYKERNIDIAVKCGLARTEEVGLSEDSQVSFYDFDIDFESPLHVKLVPTSFLPSMRIGGVSTKNGFTSRTEHVAGHQQREL